MSHRCQAAAHEKHKKNVNIYTRDVFFFSFCKWQYMKKMEWREDLGSPLDNFSHLNSNVKRVVILDKSRRSRAEPAGLIPGLKGVLGNVGVRSLNLINYVYAFLCSGDNRHCCQILGLVTLLWHGSKPPWPPGLSLAVMVIAKTAVMLSSRSFLQSMVGLGLVRSANKFEARCEKFHFLWGI